MIRPTNLVSANMSQFGLVSRLEGISDERHNPDGAVRLEAAVGVEHKVDVGELVVEFDIRNHQPRDLAEATARPLQHPPDAL